MPNADFALGILVSLITELSDAIGLCWGGLIRRVDLRNLYGELSGLLGIAL